MIDAREVHERMMRNDPNYAEEYAALEGEFAYIRKMIQARKRAGMSQADVARRMGVSQPRVARIESGSDVSLDSLRRYARATDSCLLIDFRECVSSEDATASPGG